jgi:hypothetical protein
MAKIVNIPILNDFIYTLLFNASYEKKRGLKGKYLRAAMNGTAAKAFSTNSTREEKEYIMSHFGVEFFYVVAKRNVTLLKLREILEKFEVDKKASALRDVSELGVCVTSDKEFLRLLGLMAQSIHHHSYFLNNEFQRQGYHIQKWKRHNLNAADLATRATDETAATIARLCVNTCLAMSFTPGLTGITENEMNILLYLYSTAHTYIGDEDLYSRFVGSMNKTKYRYSIKGLTKALLVQQHGTSKREFTITGQGIKQATEFINRVFSLSNVNHGTSARTLKEYA